jgi:hypothetical protein
MTNSMNATKVPAQAQLIERGRDVNRQQLLCTMDWLNTNTVTLSLKKDLYEAVKSATPDSIRQSTKDLEDALRKIGCFEWVVDGVVLSKLESPSGDPLASQELDLVQGTMYNLAVGGPAICTEGNHETIVGEKDVLADDGTTTGKKVPAIIDKRASHHAWLPLDILYVGLFADIVGSNLEKLRWNVIGSQEMYEKVYQSDFDTVLLGAYQIGKILDSAAARQRVTSGIRRTPGGCAVNLNVAITWVSTAQLKIKHGLQTKMR